LSLSTSHGRFDMIIGHGSLERALFERVQELVNSEPKGRTSRGI
jgi:hypothetical protein